MEYSYLEKLVLKAIETILNHNYTNGYIRSNKAYFKRVLEFAKTEPTFNFNQATEKKLIHFICVTYRLVENNLSTDKKDLVHRNIRAFHILESIHNNEPIKLHYKAKVIDIPSNFKPITEQYSNWLRERLECENTINTKTSRLLTFFLYLDLKKIKIKDITFSAICDYKEDLQTYGYSEAYKANILFTLKNFLLFLSQIFILKEPTDLYVGPIQSHKNARLCSYYSMNEINLVLNQIDRTTKLGKRDYLLVLLILELGLRINDVMRIKTNEILTEDNKMTLLIRKTQRLITYPLSNTILYALADYFENSRTNKISQYLFSRDYYPANEPYTRAMGYYCIKRYFIKAKINIIDKHSGPHAL
ncbi:MAG: hypothetical protein EOL97_16235 [Spirochaetia bacterium]|nr:hypothetical protein [Spirochaetia bacterium]